MTQSGFKQRLIGAIVLIALAVLFLPVIFDGKKSQQFDENFINEPEQNSELMELAIALEEQAKVQNPTNKSEKSSFLANKTESKSKVVDDKSLITKNSTSFITKSNNFVVQVASFAEQANATKLVSKLKSQGLKAYIGREKFKRAGRNMIRVLVGPMLYEKQAIQVVEQIKKSEGLKAEVVEFDPLKH